MLSCLAWVLLFSSSLARTLHAPRYEPIGPSTDVEAPWTILDRGLFPNNNYGDPGIGEPFETHCNLDPSALSKRAYVHGRKAALLDPRAPVEIKPLPPVPKSERDRAWGIYMGGGESIEIEPTQHQVDHWKIRYKDVDIPIGATGVWNSFGSATHRWNVAGLTGCTAIIVVSSRGFWAGHLWEGSTTVNGPGSFTKRFGEGKDDSEERSEPEFRTIALNILEEATPDAEKQNRERWKSFTDLENDEGDPFSDGSEVEVFILTKAKSPQDRSFLYAAKVQAIQAKIARLIRGASFQVRSYAHNDLDVSLTVRGKILIQYSPYDNDGPDGCAPRARVQVFYEDNRQPVIDKQWAPHADQANTKRKRDACGNPGWPIKTGYVAFGDSFAAGMGTGTTTSDSCRIGQANIGDLINAVTNNSAVDYQRRMCSGDSTTGLNRQIEAWTNPEKTDVATLIIGGNDIGFKDIVVNCILVPLAHPLRPIWTSRRMCKDSKAAASNMMKDTSAKGIGAKLQEAYKKIVHKSTREDFHLYVAGYPSGFFNTQTGDCNNTYFNWDRSGYCSHWYYLCHRLDNIYLTVDLRVEMNNMVVELNKIISAAVDAANRNIGRTQVHFVDVGPKYNSHRWCEPNPDPNFHEPDQNNHNTWYFLSGWPDLPPPKLGTIGEAPTPASIGLESLEDEVEFKNQMVLQGSIKLPPDDTCTDLGTDPDPWDQWLCLISDAVANDPYGNNTWTIHLKQANEEIAAKNFSGQSIGYFWPTRQIKTFHPRTPGMYAYRDVIIDAIKRVQGPSVNAGSASHTSSKESPPAAATSKAPTPVGLCTGTKSDELIDWTLTIDALRDPDSCESGADKFGHCVAGYHSDSDALDCIPRDWKPTCAPGDHSNGFTATFSTGTRCDTRMLDDCIAEDLASAGAMEMCTSAMSLAQDS